MKQSDLISIINDKSLTTKERGDALENYTLNYLNKETIHSAKKTKMSGALHGDGDIIIENKFTLDGKVKGKCTSVSITKAELDKIRQQAAKINNIGGIVVPVIQDDKVSLYVTFNLEDFDNIILI